MTAFRILDPFQVYTDANGKIASGGNLHFYTAGTTTDADVYGDNGLSVNNGPTITIGTDGRAVDDIWGDGAVSYRCRVYASDGTLIKDVDNIGNSAAAIPDFVDGDFLTNNGSAYLWAAIRQALDPTGQSGKVMGSNGASLIWQSSINPAAGSGTTLTDFILKNVRDTVQTVAAATATTIDFTQGGIVILNQAVDATLTIAAVRGATLTIHRIKDNTSTARAITWPANVKWIGGAAPTLTQTANAHDVFSLQCADGTNWIGSVGLAAS